MQNKIEKIENMIKDIKLQEKDLAQNINENQENVNKQEDRATLNYEEFENKNTQDEDIIGEIIIPKINLIAKIKEGVENKTINQYVGHFEETSKWDGNIGLAAHNRGSNIQAYFSDIKSLQKNDIIIYKTQELQRKYLVQTITIIKETNWDYLQPTEDNRITLITCVNNQPEYRLCVQAIEDKI